MGRPEYFMLMYVGSGVWQNQVMSMIEDDTMMAQAARATELIKYGVVVAASLPMLCLYPFIQKHLVSGVMIGAVKG